MLHITLQFCQNEFYITKNTTKPGYRLKLSKKYSKKLDPTQNNS